MVWVVPGNVICTTPAKAHMHVEPETRAGSPPIRVVGERGIQGVSAGTHGIGVKTPKAAAVAVATVGLARLVHMPKVGMLTGATQEMVAAGLLSISTFEAGSTSREAGAMPNEQITIAPMFTAGMATPTPYRFDPRTDEVRGCPVVVMTQTTVRSSSVQLRTEGNR